MDLSFSRYLPQSQFHEPDAQLHNMSTMEMRPSSLLPSPKHMLWEDTLPLEPYSRLRSPVERTEKFELPSIRQAIPEIQLRGGRATEPDYRIESTSYSPSGSPRALITPPEYVQSPSLHKRRRLSADDDNKYGSRDYTVPRMYRCPRRASQTPSAALSPTISARRPIVLSSTESRSSSARTSPYLPAHRHTGIESPPPFDSSIINRQEPRRTLPSLPSLTFRRWPAQPQRGRSNWSEYAMEANRSGAQTYPQFATPLDPPPSSYPPTYYSSGHQQSCGQAYPSPSSLTLDRTPFLAGTHQPGHLISTYPCGIKISDGSDGKQRKRRGNLPKDTTDKLRAWFSAHLQHPYPTEDEKQDLMQQTGLQMNQISNWFINARRRQLPAMINNARVESDARSMRVGDPGEETADDKDQTQKKGCIASLGDSDGECSGYDEDYDQMGAPRDAIQGPLKQESI